jgi:hypothetical protein
MGWVSHREKAELLGRIRAARASLRGLVSELSEAQMIAPNAVGTWSVKDVLAHLVVHEQRALEELDCALRGEPTPDDARDNDRVNADAVAASQHVSPAVAIVHWDRSYDQVVGAIELLSSADFDPDGDVAQRLGDSVHGAFASNTYDHYVEHEREIRQWMAAVTMG